MPTPKEIKLIKTAVGKLGMDDATYRSMLQRVAGVTSCKSLTPLGVARVLRELNRLGFAVEQKPFIAARANVPPSRGAMMQKIRALLADAGWEMQYADNTANRMFKIEKVEWLDDGQLNKLVAALAIDKKRRAARSGDNGRA